MTRVEVCGQKLKEKDFEKFRKAIKSEYIYEIFVDNLPVNDAVGLRVKENDYYLKTNIFFLISLDKKDRIVAVDIVSRPEDYTDISTDFNQDVNFTFSVEFTYQTNVTYDKRYQK